MTDEQRQLRTELTAHDCTCRICRKVYVGHGARCGDCTSKARTITHGIIADGRGWTRWIDARGMPRATNAAWAV